ncbi:hypothetical protein V491_05684 [Pseudogymnoascus sp. VKM F-3775]|nr:hypothetical protein V491_05684 [Pseudogymnoascus sp. VKM F-3775]
MSSQISMCLSWFLCIVCLFGITSSLPAPSKGTILSSIVDLGYSKYEGTVLEAGVNQYLGMRYAAPPVGDLRWRAPHDPDEYSTVQDASQFGATCIGSGSPGVSNMTNEDCLFINVFAPSHATTKSKLPVWFFIQGGGYSSNADRNFNGTEVIRQSNYNIVFVQINYRVGAFGFLASENIHRDGDLNVGLLDQRKALHWVQKYIHLFGGDADHVVIHGDSAGGGSIAFHLTAYGGRNDKLFAGAISESPFFPTHRSVAQSEFQYNRFVEGVGCSDHGDTLACLRSKETSALQVADVKSTFPGAPADVKPNFYFLPVLDGTFSPDYLYNLFEQGRVVRVPVIVGDDTDEGTLFSPNATSADTFLQFINSNFPLLTAWELEIIKGLYPLGTSFPHHGPWFTPAEMAYGESTFICPGIQITKSLALYLSNNKAWNYRYNVHDDAFIEAGRGVPHVSEIPAIFGPGNSGACNGCSYETYNSAIVPIVMNYWISFIRSLNPNTHKDSTAPEWQPWGSRGGQRLKIELDATGMEAVPKDQLERCLVWKSLVPVTQQ